MEKEKKDKLKLFSIILADKMKSLTVILVILLACVSALLYYQTDQNIQLSNSLTETKDRYSSLDASYNDLASRYDKLIEDSNKRLQTANNDYNILKLKYDRLNTTYSDLQRSFDDLKASFDNLKGKLNSIQSNYTSLQSSYSSLQNSYSDLKKKYDTLQSSYNDLQSSYDSLQTSYNSLQTAYNNLQSTYNDLQSILSLQKNTVLDKNKTFTLAENGTASLLYSTKYAGYIMFNFTSTQYIYFTISSNYTNIEYARYPLEGAATSGVFKIPVFPGTTKITVRNTNYFYGATVRYTINYFY